MESNDKQRQLSLSFTPKGWRFVKWYADAFGLSINGWITVVIINALERRFVMTKIEGEPPAAEFDEGDHHRFQYRLSTELYERIVRRIEVDRESRGWRGYWLGAEAYIKSWIATALRHAFLTLRDGHHYPDLQPPGKPFPAGEATGRLGDLTPTVSHRTRQPATREEQYQRYRESLAGGIIEGEADWVDEKGEAERGDK